MALHVCSQRRFLAPADHVVTADGIVLIVQEIDRSVVNGGMIAVFAELELAQKKN